MARNKRSKIIMGVAVMLMIVALVAAIVIDQIAKRNRENLGLSSELARAKTYNRVEEGEEAVEGTENVKFDAFFLRDLDGNGYATGVRGTCKEIGKEDTLYMEINVQTAGYLKDAKITVDGKNFYLQTALPKDEQLVNSYIGNNIKEIRFNNLTNGTQKLLTGIVRSGDYSYSSTINDAIGNNINNYSREDNKIILTGTYVGEDGTEKEIRKEVPFTMDWYGTTRADIDTYEQRYNIEESVDEKAGKITIDFYINTQEVNRELILKTNHTEGKIPNLNGYEPLTVEYTGSNAIFNYDKETKTFTIDRTATLEKDGEVTDTLWYSNNYRIKVTYPIDAYKTLGTESFELKIPVETYYEGYNNSNEEFTNPYKSNIKKSNIILNYSKPAGDVVRFDVIVGRYAYNPNYRYIVSKQKPLKIYNGQSEKEKDDTYIVEWIASIGTNLDLAEIIMKETENGKQQVTDQFIKTDSSEESMNGIVSNVGIYFSGADTVLGEEGEIKVYDEETNNVIARFTKENWNAYTEARPYKYETPVKHVRIETSKVISKNVTLCAYNVKEIDDEAITNKYEREQFDNLQYIKSTLEGYIGKQHVNQSIHHAYYEAPMSVAKIWINKETISTQYTEKNVQLTIETKTSERNNLVNWKDGTFLVKFPRELIDVQINNVSIDNRNVKIDYYELIEENGEIFIKIVTSNITPQDYEITIDVDVSPDSRISTTTEYIELYATNENGTNYYYQKEDIYDVNNNLNIKEQVNYDTTGISMIAPNSLLTNQTATKYDNKGSMVISPKIADIKPIYAVVNQEQQEEQTAQIGIQLRNNYASTISEIEILGKIPFEGNTYVISGKGLGSTFTTKMTNVGIQVPEELREIAKVYYSENENPDKDLNKETNNWKTAEEVKNWDNIKTFLIDLGSYVMPTGKEFIFNYIVAIPNGLEFNKVSYSHHGIYFCLDTDHGKYKTQTEPNRLGFRIAEKYDLEIQKYQKGKEKIIPGATYSITEIIQKGDGTEETGKVKTEVTGIDGTLKVTNLYANQTYEIKEIKTPDDYEKNEDVIRFIGNVDKYGILTVNKTQGTTREDMTVTKNEGENYKVTVKVEDEIKATLKIRKKEKDTESILPYARYKITGHNLPETGKTVTTNINGEATIKGLTVGQEYMITEVKAPEGYYLATEPITFKILNNEGTYKIETTGIIKENSITEENNMPVGSITLEDEKIPTYDLEITKIKRTTDVQVSNTETIEGTEQQVTYLQGAKFKLYKETKEIGEYSSNENGKIVINNLYQFVENKEENATYTLKEVLAPEGYSKVKDITFKVQENGGLKFINIDGKESKYTIEGNKVKLTIEDSPSFKLVKKDGETGELLANIKFAIYNIEEGERPATNSKGEIIGTKETIKGTEYYAVTTNGQGEITVDLPEGFYKAVEVQAPDKYDISNNTYYFGVGSSKEGKKAIQAEWANAIGGSSDDQITCIIETRDGAYIVVGSFYSSSIDLGNGVLLNNYNKNDVDFYADGMIIKYDESGNVEWANAIGGNNEDQITCIAETRDGGYIVGGYFKSNSIDLGNGEVLNNSGNYDGIIIKYDESGNVEWGKTVGGTENDQITCITETRDGGYIIGGDFDSGSIDLENRVILNNNGGQDGIIIKYDENGNVEWGKAVGGEGWDYITCITEMQDGGYLAGGYFQSTSVDLENGVVLNNNDGYDGMIIKYDESGNVEWANAIGGNNEDRITCIAETRDGGYITGGYFQSTSVDLGNGVVLNNSGNYDGIIIKYDESGNVEWGKAVGGTYDDRITCITETQDGGYAVGGYFYSTSIDLGNEVVLNNNDNDDGMIIKYDENGKVEWGKAVGGEGWDYITCITEMQDGGYAIGGNFNSYSINLGNGVILNNKSEDDGMIIKYETIEIVNVEIKEQKKLDGNIIEAMIETSDGGNLIGKSDSSNLCMIKYDSAWNVEWEKEIKGRYNDRINCIVETIDGGYIVVVSFYSSSIDLGNGIVLKNKSMYNPAEPLSDGMIIKYSADGKVEWGKVIGGEGWDYITCITETRDGGYVVGGYFKSSSIDLGNEEVLNNSGNYDGIIIKYDESGNVEWGKTVGGSNSDCINCIIETIDGGYIVGGYFKSNSIDLGNGVVLNNNGDGDGIIIKYSSEGKVEWGKAVGGSDNDEVTCITETRDRGYIVGGQFNSDNINLDNGVVLNNNNVNDGGMIIKYSEDGEVEWGKTVGESYSDGIICIAETKDTGYIVGNNNMIIKYNNSGEIEWEKATKSKIINIIETKNEKYKVVYNIEEYNDETDEYEKYGVISEVTAQMGAPEVQELIVKNTRKEFKITTEVKEIEGIKGGTITGEKQKPYETVKYGDNSTKEIIITPDKDYEIIGITINGKEHQFTANEDGTYTLSKFDNVIENKHIVVAFAMKDNKITINKTDKITKQLLPGAKFRIEQIEERSNPENVLGELTENGQIYVKIDETNKVEGAIGELVANSIGTTNVEITNEITGTLGNLTNNGEYYFAEQDGKYVPNNTGMDDTVANSYMEINLIGKAGNYAIVVNAEASSEENYDYGYATITEDTIAPDGETEEGQFIKISGEQEAQDYTSSILEGGNIYYLHLGYYKDSSGEEGNDKFTINTIDLYGATEERYNFINIDGKYESSNQGKGETISNSYIPIDLRAYIGKYNITVNAEISSEEDADYGYATITEDTIAPGVYDEEGQFIRISGEEKAKNYTTVLQGGQMYYLHLGYYKNERVDEGQDKFTVNSIQITTNDSELYRIEVETNSQGQAITQIPFGKYSITEVQAPEGYRKLEEPIVIEFRADENHEYTIENEKNAKVIVKHHKAIKNADGSYTYTEEQLSESQTLEGKIDENYTSIPHLNLGKYELIKDENGEYIVPENATGKYTQEDIEVIYYYVEKEIPLTVHHYIEGTTQKVLLKDGIKAEDIIRKGKENEEYTTEAISDELLSEQYELVEIPKNANGIFTGEEIIVTYYYKKAKRELELNKYSEDGKTPLEGVKFTITPKEENTESTETSIPTETSTYTTNSQGKIKLELEVGEYEVTEIEVPEGYQLPEEATIKIEITKETEIAKVEITNTKKRGTVITHHYIEGTENKVPKEDGTVVEDETQTGILGEPFATKVSEEIPAYYEYVSSSEKTSGEYTEETQEVIYYYKLKEQDDLYGYTVNYLEKGTENVIKEQKVEENQVFGSTIKAVDEVIEIDGYNYDSCDKTEIAIAKENNVINLYYTKRKDLSYVVNYLEEDTNEKLHESKTAENQLFGATITTLSEVIEIEGYEYSSVNKDKLTIVTDETQNIINIYYIKRSDLKYTVNYLEKDTNEVLHEPKKVENQVYGGTIKSSTEVIEIPGYNYDSVEKENITIQVDETKNVINIYYTKRTDIKYTVEYYYDEVKDENETEENTATFKEVIDVYEDKIKEGYVFVEVKGIPLEIGADETKNIIEVYYAKETTATVKYIDKTTNEILEERTEKGYVGKEFVTEAKDFENYVLVEEPEEKTVLMKEDEVIVKYYYVHVSSGVIEKHIDIDTDEILYNTTHEGNEGDEYKTEPKEFKGYILVEDKYPENAEGKMERAVITVNYYYKKKEEAKVTIKYIDKETNEEIEEKVIIEGYKEDEYKTEQKEIEGYEFIEAVGEQEGIMTGEKEVIYYYQKIKEPEIPGEGGSGNEEKPTEPQDPTTIDKVIPSAGLTKEQIAIIAVTIMAAITGIIVVVGVKGIKLDKKR